MKTYFCKWPDGTISILTAQDETDVFFKLDAEGSPYGDNVFVYQLPTNFHIGTEWLKNNNGEMEISADLVYDSNCLEDLKRIKFNLETIYKELHEQNENISN